MKFKKLIINNFMRLKGENTIEFSTLPDKNVTVVLGDNTVGKTTLAQAIRWCLYGNIISTQYDNSKNICLLNTDILNDMTANDRKEISVELDIENSINGQDRSCRILRRAGFVRKFPQLVAVQKTESLKMYIKNPNTGSEEPYDNIGKDAGKVDDMISELLPKDLSSYFLFDGERWSDAKNTQNDIKDSIYTLVGISPIRQMKEHLGDLGTNGRSSVIKRLGDKKTGSGTEYNTIENSIKDYYSRIEAQNHEIEDAKNNADYYQKKADEIEAILNANPNVEKDQKECEKIKRDIESGTSRIEKYKRDIVTRFSDSHVYFAAPLLQDVIDMLDGVDLQGSDIPDVTDKTIYAILQNGRCLCGHEVHKDSFEEKELLKLLEIVPPAKIGTVVENFKDKLANWSNRSANLYDSIKEDAESYQQESDDIEDLKENLAIKEKKIDKKINFAGERKKMNSYLIKVREANQTISNDKAVIENLKHKIVMEEDKKKDLEAKNKENEKLDRYIAYAKALYKSANEIYQEKEQNLLCELNQIIEKNFREMFNEQEKYAKLEDDYTLHLYYRNLRDSNGYANAEATGLSEGEKIARNFAFIVSILELANKMKDEGDDAQAMPLVLDGPFSKLSDINTAKVARVLPKVANQVIIFMLDKDWEPSGLAEYTDANYMYRLEKSIEENSSEVKKQKEVAE